MFAALTVWLAVVSMRDEPCEVAEPMVIVPAPAMFWAPPPIDCSHAVLPLASPAIVILPPPLRVTCCALAVLLRRMALAFGPLALTRIASPVPFVPVVVMLCAPGNGAR